MLRSFQPRPPELRGTAPGFDPYASGGRSSTRSPCGPTPGGLSFVPTTDRMSEPATDRMGEADRSSEQQQHSSSSTPRAVSRPGETSDPVRFVPASQAASGGGQTEWLRGADVLAQQASGSSFVPPSRGGPNSSRSPYGTPLGSLPFAPEANRSSEADRSSEQQQQRSSSSTPRAIRRQGQTGDASRFVPASQGPSGGGGHSEWLRGADVLCQQASMHLQLLLGSAGMGHDFAPGLKNNDTASHATIVRQTRVGTNASGERNETTTSLEKNERDYAVIGQIMKRQWKERQQQRQQQAMQYRPRERQETRLNSRTTMVRSNLCPQL
jgi:hypothetical protein